MCNNTRTITQRFVTSSSIVTSMSVCLSARVTRKPHGRTSPNLYSCCHGSVLFCRRCDSLFAWFVILSVCGRRLRRVFIPSGPMDLNQAGRYVLKKFAMRYQLDVRQLQCLVTFIRMRHLGPSLICTVALLCVHMFYSSKWWWNSSEFSAIFRLCFVLTLCVTWLQTARA